MAQVRDDVLLAAQAAFPGGDLADLAAILGLYGTEPYERERERVQLAIITLSGGDPDKLRQLVRDAKRDYRDILAWQELGPMPAAEGKQLQDKARSLIDKWGKK
jgi:hypothetical protein